MSDLTLTQPAIEVRGLVKTYAGRTVVDHLDLTAKSGQVTAVLGPNGAGKTTTVECCEGLLRADAGEVRVLGLDPHADAAALRPRVGVMLQDAGLPTGAPALSVLRHVAAMYDQPWPVEDLVDRLGIAAFARTTVRRLSGGQRQRLALATAIVGRPSVVFLDEPSAGLDPQARRAVWGLVGELRTAGVSIVLTTHLMDEAAELADWVAVVDRGRVIAQGTVQDLTHHHAASGAVELHATAGLDAGGLSQAIRGYADHGNPSGEPENNRTLVQVLAPGRFRIDTVGTPGLLATVADWCADQGVLITRWETEPARTLEDVFLELTGRSLR